MKAQDIIFIVILVLVFLTKKSKLSALLGLGCIIVAIPLFAKWIFFTAERLTWYSAAFFLLSIILQACYNKYHA